MLQRPDLAVRQTVYWVIGGLCLFGWRLFANITSSFNMADESWVLLVAHRVVSGDVLYRDVYFGATPLSIYLVALGIKIFGSEILILKVLEALFFTGIVLLCCRIARQLGASRAALLVLTAALLIHLPLGIYTFYTPLATLFVFGCFSAVLSWREQIKTASKTHTTLTQGSAALLLASVAAGLCFVSKQNIGVYVLAALVLTLALTAREVRLSRQSIITAVTLVVVGFISSVLLALVPIVLSGGTEKLLEHGFLNKGTYVRFGQLSYFYGLGQLAFFAQHLNSWEHLQSFYLESIFVLPPLTVLALLVTWLRLTPTERRTALVLVLFVGVSFLSLFPRADNAHVTWAVPASLLGLVYAWRCLTTNLNRVVFAPRSPQAGEEEQRAHFLKEKYRVLSGSCRRLFLPLQAVLVLWLGIGLCVALVPPFERVFSSRYQSSPLPHFRGVLIRDDHHTALTILSRELRAATADKQPCLLITPIAPFFYLASGLKNPTPFDYPLVNTFGKDGEANVIAAIERRQIHTVCLGSIGSQAMTPTRLVHFVHTRMEPRGSLPFCTLYQVRP